MFYSDKDKYKFLETIAKVYNKVEAHYEEQTSSSSKEKEIDLIFRADFRKGRPFFEEEQRLKALSGEGFTEEVVDEYAQEDTDWDVQAVEDEDQL
jgi:glycerol-3-phosphate cytidylyltransferase-like family protein